MRRRVSLYKGLDNTAFLIYRTTCVCVCRLMSHTVQSQNIARSLLLHAKANNAVHAHVWCTI